MDNKTQMQIDALEKEVKELKKENERLFRMVESITKLKADFDRVKNIVQRMAQLTLPRDRYDDVDKMAEVTYPEVHKV